jgi:hypothetical protein
MAIIVNEVVHKSKLDRSEFLRRALAEKVRREGG